MATLLIVDEGGLAGAVSILRGIEFGFNMGDDTAPTITNVDPAEGAVIQRSDAIAFDVQDEAALAKVLVLVEFTSGLYEVAHDGDRFSALYAQGSTRGEITLGYHFSLRRATGWLPGPTIRVIGIDRGGNEV